MISPAFPELSHQQPLWKEEEDNYQHQDRSYSLDQDDLKPPQIKEEQEEETSMSTSCEEPSSRDELSQQQTLWKEEEDDYQHQDRSCSLDQEDSKPPQIKDEQEETCCYQDGESLTVKQEMDTLMVTIHEQDDDSELGLNPDQSQEKPEVNTTVQSPVLPEPDCDLQLLSYSPHISESKDEENRTSEDSSFVSFSPAYPDLGRGGGSFRRDAQTALSPATSISSSGGAPSGSQARQGT
ncbi:hypothetical protein D4764_08G0001030 [Takifugu flavidus]|uniref:Uncharacterized protein n=1 Tax=Takifugu flavidus TaxID=433684 RepID=A0A5C6MLV5_9TELE|nr:hypothetical protein D4764_08G0001030 [Takifugu flavidus]